MCDGGLIGKVANVSPLNRMIIDKLPSSPISGAGLLKRDKKPSASSAGKVAANV